MQRTARKAGIEDAQWMPSESYMSECHVRYRLGKSWRERMKESGREKKGERDNRHTYKK